MDNTMNNTSLDLSNIKSWKNNAIKFINKHVPVNRIKKIDFECIDPHDMNWVNIIYNYDINVIELFVEFINTEYKYIKSFHGTRTDNINSFSQKGIVKPSYKDMEDKAKKIFNNRDFPELDQNKLDKAIKESRKYKVGTIYFNLQENFLTDTDFSADHYITFGSEHIQSIAANLGNGYKEKLKDCGKPFILECNIPMELVQLTNLEQISSFMLYEIFNADCDEKIRLKDSDVSIELQKTLPSIFIVNIKSI